LDSWGFAVAAGFSLLPYGFFPGGSPEELGLEILGAFCKESRICCCSAAEVSPKRSGGSPSSPDSTFSWGIGPVSFFVRVHTQVFSASVTAGRMYFLVSLTGRRTRGNGTSELVLYKVRGFSSLSSLQQQQGVWHRWTTTAASEPFAVRSTLVGAPRLRRLDWVEVEARQGKSLRTSSRRSSRSCGSCTLLGIHHKASDENKKKNR